LNIQNATALRVNGLREKWNHKSILGITDDETVMLDFDNTPFKWVKHWALRTTKRFNLEGFIILKSSENNYHVVFNRKVSWSENMRVVAWVSLLSRNRHLTKWFLMQCIKEGSTLRVSPKLVNPKPKPMPRVVYRYGKQDGQVMDFLKWRRFVKNVIRKMMAGHSKCTFTTICTV
jgi:hypothetical protein